MHNAALYLITNTYSHSTGFDWLGLSAFCWWFLFLQFSALAIICTLVRAITDAVRFCHSSQLNAQFDYTAEFVMPNLIIELISNE